MALGLIRTLGIVFLITTILAYNESSLGNVVNLNYKDGAKGYACAKAYKIFFEGCNLYPGNAPGCIVRINDFWDGEVNSDYYKIASVTKISNVCHNVKTPNFEFSYSHVDKLDGYNSELWLQLTKNQDSEPWGYFIIPLSGASSAKTLTNTSSHLTVTSVNNLLTTSGPLATFEANYDTPLVYYTGTNGQKYFYFMEYQNSATNFDVIAETKCPEITVSSQTLRNCWDADMAQGYLDFVSTGIRTNFALWVFIMMMLIFFIWSNGAENESGLSQNYEDFNIWFQNPLWSIVNCGTPEYHKTARLTLQVTNFSCIEFVISVCYKLAVNNGMSIRDYSAGQPFVAIFFGQIVTLFLGSWLYNMYQIVDKYADDYKRNKDTKFRDYLTDKYQLTIIQKKFEFYLIALFLNAGFFIGSMALIQHMELNDMWLWFAGVFGIFFIDILWHDLMMVWLAKCFPSLVSVFARRGYYIKYSTLVKMKTLELD